MNSSRETAAALVLLGACVFVGCQTSGTTGAQSRALAVRTGTITQYPNVPIGKAFEATFTSPQWKSGESEKGVKFVDFTGNFQKVAFDKSHAVYRSCVDPRIEVKQMPNYGFVKAIGNYNLPILSSETDARTINVRGALLSDPGWWKRAEFWQGQTQFAEQNKGDETSIAKAYNDGGDPMLIEFFGKIGSGNPNFERFVKEFGDQTVCGEENSFNSVKFQFQIAANGQSFSLSGIEMAPWQRIGMTTEESILKYVFE